MDMQQRTARLTASCPRRWFSYRSWLPNSKRYCTWLCRNKTMQSFPSSDLKCSVCARRECLQACQRRFKIFSLLSAPTHFSLCTAAQICKSSLLRMQSTRSAPIYSILLSPSFSVHSCSLFLPPPSPPTVSSLFGLSCSVHSICPIWGVVLWWEDFYWVPSGLWLSNEVQRSFTEPECGHRNTNTLKGCACFNVVVVESCLHHAHATKRTSPFPPVN